MIRVNNSFADFVISITTLKKNQVYIILILLIFICEIYARVVEASNIHGLWVSAFHILSFLSLAFWYFQMQKHKLYSVEKLFLGSLLIPVFTPIADYFLIKQQAIFIIILTSIFYFIIWIFIFKKIGAKLILKKHKSGFIKFYLFILILPLIYYFVALIDKLSTIFLIEILILYFLFSYTSLLSVQLPINDTKKKWIVLGLMVYIFHTILFSYNYFLLSLEYGDIYSRILIVTSRCMIIYGMIDYDIELKIKKFD